MTSPVIDYGVGRQNPASHIWTRLELIAFRIAFVYLTLDTLPRLIYALPGDWVRYPTMIDGAIWRPIVPWVARHILHLHKQITAFQSGSDSAYAYLQAFSQLLLAIGAAAVWTALASRRTEHRKLHYWLRVLVRFEVAFTMLRYGASKVFAMQFPAPSLVDLISAVGSLKPGALLWSFMGISRPYQIFTGGIECLGGILLLWRQTTTLGALITSAAIANVLMLDLSYGVPLKIVTIHLLLGAAFLMTPDLPRLAGLLVLGRPTTAPCAGRPSMGSPVVRKLALGAKVILLVYLIGFPSLTAYRASKQRASNERKMPLYGLYTVGRFSRNGADIALGESQRWQLVAMDGSAETFSTMAIRSADESWQSMIINYDEAKRAVRIRNIPITVGLTGPGPSGGGTLAATRTMDGLLLKGDFGHDKVEISLHQIPVPQLALTQPYPVHWITMW